MGDSASRVITEFRGAYAFLSNFYEAPMVFQGISYRNAEAAFQAQKCLTDDAKWEFSELPPTKAKHKGRRVALRPDWENVKVALMEEVVRTKFAENEVLKALLLATGDAELQEGNTWNDTFWGVSSKTGKGKNTLGKILMKVRGELQQNTSES